MKVRAGYEISYACVQPTPMLTMLSIHPTQTTALLSADLMRSDPSVPAKEYLDGFGNICHVIHAPAGSITLSSDFLIRDSGAADEVAPDAQQVSMENLPVDTLVYLLGSRYCETDRFAEFAWAKFGNHPKGWPLVQAICDYVHQHLQFGYQHANPTKSAWLAHQERKGVCRDFAHLAITLCRCMNVPARYCTGYLGDIGVPPDPAPMDFSAWFEVFLGDRWYTFDARHNIPRIGRILMARGRDATDVALSTSFGPCQLTGFRIFTDEVRDDASDHLLGNVPLSQDLRRELEMGAIVVAEDDLIISEHLTGILMDKGYSVIAVANAADAIAVFEHRDDIRMLITDINMPGSENGLTLAATVRERWPLVKIVITTGQERPKIEQVPTGSLYLRKPYTAGSVMAAVLSLF